MKNWNIDSGILSTALLKLGPKIGFAKDKFSALELESLSANSIRVGMQLGASKCQATIEKDSEGHPALVILGMAARCLDQGAPARTALGVLLNEPSERTRVSDQLHQ